MGDVRSVAPIIAQSTITFAGRPLPTTQPYCCTLIAVCEHGQAESDAQVGPCLQALCNHKDLDCKWVGQLVEDLCDGDPSRTRSFMQCVCAASINRYCRPRRITEKGPHPNYINQARCSQGSVRKKRQQPQVGGKAPPKARRKLGKFAARTAAAGASASAAVGASAAAGASAAGAMPAGSAPMKRPAAAKKKRKKKGTTQVWEKYKYSVTCLICGSSDCKSMRVCID